MRVLGHSRLCRWQQGSLVAGSCRCLGVRRAPKSTAVPWGVRGSRKPRGAQGTLEETAVSGVRHCQAELRLGAQRSGCCWINLAQVVP